MPLLSALLLTYQHATDPRMTSQIEFFWNRPGTVVELILADCIWAVLLLQRNTGNVSA